MRPAAALLLAALFAAGPIAAQTTGELPALSFQVTAGAPAVVWPVVLEGQEETAVELEVSWESPEEATRFRDGGLALRFDDRKDIRWDEPTPQSVIFRTDGSSGLYVAVRASAELPPQTVATRLRLRRTVGAQEVSFTIPIEVRVAPAAGSNLFWAILAILPIVLTALALLVLWNNTYFINPRRLTRQLKPFRIRNGMPYVDSRTDPQLEARLLQALAWSKRLGYWCRFVPKMLLKPMKHQYHETIELNLRSPRLPMVFNPQPPVDPSSLMGGPGSPYRSKLLAYASGRKTMRFTGVPVGAARRGERKVGGLYVWIQPGQKSVAIGKPLKFSGKLFLSARPDEESWGREEGAAVGWRLENR